ncbi:ABC transporter permease [Flammeovirga sp. OC4]|uniref:ABC transporter permease n=1 Tax=Flammeovirga sp. OC4 TaxID=1382345 RepID=UPI0006948FE3|nr:ABC transporter permease [Flammeovirga sp. OC4]
MIKHSLQILWTRKKKNALMVVEIAFSFIILFLLFSLLYNKFQNYAHPVGFETEKVMIVKLDLSQLPEKNTSKEGQDQLYDAVKQVIAQNEEVEEIAEMDYAHPYSGSTNSTRWKLNDGVTFWPIEQNLRPSAVQFMDFNYIKGGPFTFEDAQHDYEPVIVTNYFYEKLKPYLNEEDMLISDEVKIKIFGVIDYYNRSSDFQDQEDIAIRCFDHYEWFKNKHQSNIFVKTQNDPRKIEANIVNSLERLNPDLKIGIDYFEDLQAEQNQWEILPLFLMSFVAFFLVINIALGLYGVLWYNITKRKSEIGIRRAMGASKQDIFFQMFSEVILLFIIGVVLGGVFAIQFPILGAFNYSNTEYFMGALLSLGFVLLITIACGYYPSKLATKVTPNEALHEL